MRILRAVRRAVSGARGRAARQGTRPGPQPGQTGPAVAEREAPPGPPPGQAGPVLAVPEARAGAGRDPHPSPAGPVLPVREVRAGAGRGPTPRRAAVALGIVGALAVPWVLGPYPVLMLSHALILGLLAMSANLLTGVTGLPTLGQAAYLGVGGYAAATVARAVTPVGVAQLLAAVVAATAAALLTGTVVARSHGIVAIMVTLAVAELLHEAAVRWTPVTGGTDGLSGIGDVVPFWGLPPLPLDGQVYYYVLAVFAVLAAAVAALVRSPVGLVLRGIRDHASRMRAHGYPVFRYRLLAQGLAGGLAGAAGALTVSAQRYFSPADLGFDVSALALLAVVIGGTGSMWGACAGAALLVVLRDQGLLGAHNGLLLGVTCLVAVYALPGGLAGLPRRLANLRRARP